MNDFEKKIQQMALITAEEDVRTISGVPHGCLYYSKNSRSQRRENISQVWPNLELYMHGGVSAPYKNQFEKLIPKASII